MKKVIRSVALISFVLAAPTFAEEIRILSWNVESGGAQPSAVADRIRTMEGIDIFGFCEVSDYDWALQFERAAEVQENGDFKPILGMTGQDDRLLILYDKQQFSEVEEPFEIDWQDRPWYQPTMRPRSALVAHLRHTGTGQDFYFMVNHLYRGSGVDPRRLDQATALNQWAAAQTIPVIAVGDYNFDWSIADPNDRTAKGFGNMTANGTFRWLEPTTLITTHDSNYNSILDFIFIAHAGTLTGSSTILVAEDEFTPTSEKPDHRPVLGVLEFGTHVETRREHMLRLIGEIERQLAALKALVEEE